MKKSDILFFLFVIALFLPFFISDTIYEWYKSFNAIHGMVMSFVKFAILATLGEMLGLRISTHHPSWRGMGNKVLVSMS